MRFILIDANSSIVEKWNQQIKKWKNLISSYKKSGIINISNLPKIQCHHTTINDYMRTEKLFAFQTSIVTATNSLSYMNGGFDKYLTESMSIIMKLHNFDDPRDAYPREIGDTIQRYQLGKNNGFLVPGQVYPVNLLELFKNTNFNYKRTLMYNDLKVDELIQIPTMIVPESIDNNEGISQIFNIMWNLLNYLNKYQVSEKDRYVIIPGIGTGFGNLDENEVTKVMIFAIFLFNIKFDRIEIDSSDIDLEVENTSKLKESTNKADWLNDKGMLKSIMILFFLNKEYRHFRDKADIYEIEQVLSDYGKSYNFESKNKAMEIDELFKCFKF
ncbi:uncharacterized protein KGF55_004650 [Candida pseudojiufengensis]|uniref:uncharacterized protein n=1 Tax=Candida pseudojiufengensis TaxID=497109 RepID=UPI002224BAB9|nr:uncharacterized protein KGF55_004650 [Candida pseudojiufengensis]KAI5960358.1 hypothetical protein KGF55_004650 [Candida pseudojiufengensis]